MIARHDEPIPQDLIHELQEDLYAKTGRQWAQITSGSMRPLLQVDDTVLIERVAPQDVRWGDIVLFRTEGRRVVHRVIGKGRRQGEPAFLEKGDFNQGTSWVLAEQVCGRVVAVRHGDRETCLLSVRGYALQWSLTACSLATIVLKPLLRRVFKTAEGRGLGRRFDGAISAGQQLLLRLFGTR